MNQHSYLQHFDQIQVIKYVGHVTKVGSGFIEAEGPLNTIGGLCKVECTTDNQKEIKTLMAEVISINQSRTVLAPFKSSTSIPLGAKITALPHAGLGPVGDVFRGRLVNSLGQPIDNTATIPTIKFWPLYGEIMEPTQRQDPSNIFVTGIKAIDGLLSLGLGQRVGIFAASGVGKTTLVNQIIGQVNVDKCVVCLVGERGREVEAFWQSKSDMIKSGRITCVAATSDMSAIMRIRAVNQAMCLAEYWRSKGEHVLLIIDSVTRYAMALREVGLASGEPPTLRAYTPNVFESLPRLVERCGGMKTGGSITAIMTILSETDDVDDPIVEVMKSLLDGHIILSRQLAELGHFPAIDVSKSKSRLAHKLMDAEHDKNMRRAISMLSAFEEARIIIESGVYKSGTNPLIDTAINSQDDLSAFLTQECNDNIPLDNTLEWLAKITNGENAHV